MLIYSVAIKAYREDIANNFEEDPLKGKLTEFNNKFKEFEK